MVTSKLCSRSSFARRAAACRVSSSAGNLAPRSFRRPDQHAIEFSPNAPHQARFESRARMTGVRADRAARIAIGQPEVRHQLPAPLPTGSAMLSRARLCLRNWGRRRGYELRAPLPFQRGRMSEGGLHVKSVMDRARRPAFRRLQSNVATQIPSWFLSIAVERTGCAGVAPM
jgi:hypothetical protein